MQHRPDGLRDGMRRDRDRQPELRQMRNDLRDGDNLSGRIVRVRVRARLVRRLVPAIERRALRHELRRMSGYRGLQRRRVRHELPRRQYCVLRWRVQLGDELCRLRRQLHSVLRRFDLHGRGMRVCHGGSDALWFSGELRRYHLEHHQLRRVRDHVHGERDVHERHLQRRRQWGCRR
jgi:hypothetical protein